MQLARSGVVENKNVCAYNYSMLKGAPYRGFTIVELLITIVVVGILASITITAYGGI